MVETAEAIWLLQPVVGEKRKCARPDVLKATKAAVKRGATPAELLEALRTFYALPANTEADGKFAKGAVPMLNEDRWKDFRAGAVKPPGPSFDGPPKLREMVVHQAGEDFAANYIDPSHWDAEARTLTAPNKFSAGKLEAECGSILIRCHVTVVAMTPVKKLERVA